MYYFLNKHKLKYSGKVCPFINRHQGAFLARLLDMIAKFPYKVSGTRLILIIN